MLHTRVLAFESVHVRAILSLSTWYRPSLRHDGALPSCLPTPPWRLQRGWVALQATPLWHVKLFVVRYCHPRNTQKTSRILPLNSLWSHQLILFYHHVLVATFITNKKKVHESRGWWKSRRNTQVRRAESESLLNPFSLHLFLLCPWARQSRLNRFRGLFSS